MGMSSVLTSVRFHDNETTRRAMRAKGLLAEIWCIADSSQYMRGAIVFLMYYVLLSLVYVTGVVY